MFWYKIFFCAAAKHNAHGFLGWKESLFLCVLPPVLLLGDTGSLLWLADWSISLLESVVLEGLCDFLFLISIFPISSWGLGRGPPGSSCQKTHKHIGHNSTVAGLKSQTGQDHTTSNRSGTWYSQDICPEGQSTEPLQIWIYSIQPF